MSAQGSNKAVLAAFLANLGIAVAKFIGFVFTGSSAMLAESIHSAADTGNQALLFLGQKLSQRKATPQHPFGFGRERYFWAFVVSIVIFILGSIFSVSEGVEKILEPSPLEDLGWAIGASLHRVPSNGPHTPS